MISKKGKILYAHQGLTNNYMLRTDIQLHLT